MRLKYFASQQGSALVSVLLATAVVIAFTTGLMLIYTNATRYQTSAEFHQQAVAYTNMLKNILLDQTFCTEYFQNVEFDPTDSAIRTQAIVAPADSSDFLGFTNGPGTHSSATSAQISPGAMIGSNVQVTSFTLTWQQNLLPAPYFYTIDRHTPPADQPPAASTDYLWPFMGIVGIEFKNVGVLMGGKGQDNGLVNRLTLTLPPTYFVARSTSASGSLWSIYKCLPPAQSVAAAFFNQGYLASPCPVSPSATSCPTGTYLTGFTPTFIPSGGNLGQARISNLRCCPVANY